MDNIFTFAVALLVIVILAVVFVNAICGNFIFVLGVLFFLSLTNDSNLLSNIVSGLMGSD